jgi:hypothetical protein
MGHFFRIWPEIILVNGTKMTCFNLAIDNDNRVRRSYEKRAYALMEGARIIFQRKRLSHKTFCSTVWGTAR